MRLIKRVVALLLVLLLSIESFAAVVSDNDGSAFITKAEFDSLKNDFQSQVDQYNSSIDNKIDGAIASYLAGINMQKLSLISPLCYFDGETILSLRENYADLNWQEGVMNIGMQIWYMTSSGAGSAVIGVVGTAGKDATAFKELTINKLMRNTTTPAKSRAIWGGVKAKKYVMNLLGKNQNWSWNPDSLPSQLHIGPGYGVCPISNSANFFMYTNGSGAGHGQMIAPVYGTSATNAWSYSEYTNYYNVSEIVDSISYKHLVVNYDNVCKRFTNEDGYTDWCYDADGYGSSSIHTQWTNGSQLFSLFKGNDLLRLASGGRTSGSPWTYADNTHQQAGRDSEFGWKRVLPWNGFVKELTNWNQIATSDYDAIAKTLIQKYPQDSYFIDSEGITHLLLAAGVPIYYNESSSESSIVIDLEFKDKTRDYAVFFKNRPFVKGYGPIADANIDHNSVIKGSDENGPKSDQGLFNNSVLVHNGNAQFRIELQPGECLFIKWRFNDNAISGGGELIPPKTIKLYS